MGFLISHKWSLSMALVLPVSNKKNEAMLWTLFVSPVPLPLTPCTPAILLLNSLSHLRLAVGGREGGSRTASSPNFLALAHACRR